MEKIRWGVIGTGKIGLLKTIPAMQLGKYCAINAIASRDLSRAQAAAGPLGIPTAYGSYEALLADPAIDAVYIALPNHLHVPLSIQSIEAGKHVLCEKPIGLDAADAERLAAASARVPRLKVMEAFMYRHHPQWIKTMEIVRGGGIGELRAVHSVFSYFNVDAANIRNQRDIGGGGLMDIGCYNISLSRFVFDDEPQRVMATATLDPAFKTDTLTSGILEFRGGPALFTCSTQLVSYQRVNIFGTEGRVELEIPFNAPPDASHWLWHQRGRDTTVLSVGPHDQYQIQGDLFSRAILDDTPVPTPLSDALANMRVIDRVFRSAESGQPA
ncbi:MAG: Gfo/Idh/MocA family oxidoreductase [Acidobacteriota bacterium]